jgi:CRISPR-associated endonuclease Cas1
MSVSTLVSVDVCTEQSQKITPRYGVVTLFGYGTSVRVDRGHLILEDGIGPDRRHARFPRVGHGLRRLVVIGADGMVSLAALRWLADQEATFVMLDRDGSVLATTGPVQSSDAKLRRAQAFAAESGAAVQITKKLIGHKLLGQAQIAQERLHDVTAAERITELRARVDSAGSVLAIRQLESLAAKAYWHAWRNVPINFPRIDWCRVPDHWRTFGTRESLLTGSPRLAVNPPNAILNYLYAVLESEARLAAAALGLDPGLGVLHLDTPNRDSLACDLMEPVRPKVDAYLLDWIMRGPLRKEWFFEQRNGNCRLMGPFAAQLSETAPSWGSAVASYAERAARILWSTIQRSARKFSLATRLTQSHRRQAKGGTADLPARPTPRPRVLCRICGVPINSGDKYCRVCAVTVSKENLIEAAKFGRVATHSAKAEALRSATQRRQAAALKAWNPVDKPDWLDEKTYREKILPRLAAITAPTILSALAVSEPYATNIRAGRRIPHPRHWLALARLVGVSSDE